ncbi:MAG: hypothetical protein O3B64_00025 [bacterium]|nr:hypothetical protein [bacterium]MDA1024482.1 hypothetical protein [bacterium]
MKKRNFTQLDAVQAYTKKGTPKGIQEQIIAKAVARILALLILFLGAIFLIIRMPFLRYKSIEILTNTEEIESYRALANNELDQSSFFLPRGSVFLVRKELIEQSFKSSFDVLSVEVGSDERVLTVSITPKPAASLLLLDGLQYAISFDGVITDDISIVSQNSITIRISEGAGEIANGAQLLSSDRMASLHKAVNIFANVIDTQEILLEQSASRWAQLKSKDGYAILFELDTDIERVYERYTTVIDQYQNEIDQLDYIDLRFGNKVFIK